MYLSSLALYLRYINSSALANFNLSKNYHWGLTEEGMIVPQKTLRAGTSVPTKPIIFYE